VVGAQSTQVWGPLMKQRSQATGSTLREIFVEQSSFEFALKVVKYQPQASDVRTHARSMTKQVLAKLKGREQLVAIDIEISKFAALGNCKACTRQNIFAKAFHSVYVRTYTAPKRKCCS